MTRLVFLSTVLLATLTLGSVSHAAPSDHSKALLTMLRAIDTLPTADAIRKTTGTPEKALRAVADDELLGQYVRRRATSLLSLFPGRRAAQHLKELATSRAQRVRWVATYTFIRMHGTTAPKRARSFAKQTLTKRGEGCREAAIRGLRHVPGTATARLVERHAKKETAAKVLAAIRRFRESRKH